VDANPVKIFPQNFSTCPIKEVEYGKAGGQIFTRKDISRLKETNCTNSKSTQMPLTSGSIEPGRRFLGKYHQPFCAM
jgi:hypothetical protein